MLRIRWLVLMVVVILISWLAPVSAQQSNPSKITHSQTLVGETINYQGMLMDGSTYPSGVFDFQFTLYDDPTAGSVIGQLNSDNIVVTQGQFSTDLSFNEGSFTGHQRWLAIAVKSDSGSVYVPLSPRQPLTAAPIALSLPGLWTRQNETSPNLIGGYSGNMVPAQGVGISIGGGGTFGELQQVYDNYTVIGGGAKNSAGSNDGNVANDGYATISGGFENTTTQEYTVIGGGQTNSISGAWSVISGGTTNTISDRFSTIGGGSYNLVQAQFGTIGGGGSTTNTTGNRVYDNYSTIGGGYNNQAGGQDANPGTQPFTTIGGGSTNMAGAVGSTIGGGRTNTTSGDYSVIGGGYNNSATALYATVGGGGSATNATGNRAYDNYTTVGGGYNNVAGINDAVGQPFATVSGGGSNTASGYASTIGGGRVNSASGEYAVIGGGYNNSARANYATIGGGGSSTIAEANYVYDHFGTIGGGFNNQVGTDDGDPNLQAMGTIGGGGSNTASGYASTVSGGRTNTASGTYSSIGGGRANLASGLYTTIGAGFQNQAQGDYSAVLGGSGNTTIAAYSIAAGENAVAAHRGSFVWAGAQATSQDTLASTGPGQFIIRAPGGAWFGSSTTVDIPDGAILATDSGAFLSKGGTWSNSSDKHRKTEFAAIDPQTLLSKLATIPMQSWSYINEGPQIRHIGPTAQDFYAAFGLGSDDRHIATVDADGVALTAIQGLYQLNTDQAQIIANQAAQLQQFEDRLRAIEAPQSPQTIPWFGFLGWGGFLLGTGLVIGMRMRQRRLG